jgi:Signal transduction histidine kinase
MNGEGIDSSLIACAYELKTPLILMRQLSLELENTNDIKRQKEICQQMRITAERSLRLADNLTKTARLEDAMFELEPVHVSSLCREVADEMSPLADFMSQKVIVKSTRKAPVCVGNRELLRSLLIGLVDNALQCTQEHDNVYITTRINRSGIELAVRDSGPVIDLANFKKLKDSLGKHNQPILARPSLSGLGVVIAEKLINAMHGELFISRHYSGGVTFKALLPISRQLSILEL